MGCITDAMHITVALNHVSSWNYLLFPYHLSDFTLVTCPILPGSEVTSCEQFPPHPVVYKANWACQNQNNYEAKTLCLSDLYSTLLYTTSSAVIFKQTSEKLRHQLNQVLYRSSGANALWRALAEPWTVGNTVIHWATQSFTSISAYPDGSKGTKGQ